jgi:hypothetical protein
VESVDIQGLYNKPYSLSDNSEYDADNSDNNKKELMIFEPLTFHKSVETEPKEEFKFEGRGHTDQKMGIG